MKVNMRSFAKAIIQVKLESKMSCPHRRIIYQYHPLIFANTSSHKSIIENISYRVLFSLFCTRFMYYILQVLQNKLKTTGKLLNIVQCRCN